MRNCENQDLLIRAICQGYSTCTLDRQIFATEDPRRVAQAYGKAQGLAKIYAHRQLLERVRGCTQLPFLKKELTTLEAEISRMDRRRR